MKKKEEELPAFTTPKCTKCNVEAEYIQDDNGGCDDPECCGGNVEFTILKCPKCGAEENLRYK